MSELDDFELLGHDNFKAELVHTSEGKKIKLEARTFEQLKHKAFLIIDRNGWDFSDCPITVTKPKGTVLEWRKTTKTPKQIHKTAAKALTNLTFETGSGQMCLIKP